MADERLEHTLLSYRCTLRAYREGQAGERGRQLLPTIERILELGARCRTFAEFSQRLETSGLLDALDGG